MSGLLVDAHEHDMDMALSTHEALAIFDEPREARAEPDPAVLLTRQRAAEHVLLAIAEARDDLLTPAILHALGCFTAIATSEDTPHCWDFGGYTFAQSGAVAVLGAAAVVTAPLEVPTLAFGGAAFVASHVSAWLSEQPNEAIREQEQQRFKATYGITRDALRWSLAPPGPRYWYLEPGDTVLELVLKARRGLLGMGEAPEKARRLLRKLLSLLPGTAEERSERLEAAVAKAERDLQSLSVHFDLEAAEARETLRQQCAQERAAAAAAAAHEKPQSDDGDEAQLAADGGWEEVMPMADDDDDEAEACALGGGAGGGGGGTLPAGGSSSARCTARSASSAGSGGASSARSGGSSAACSVCLAHKRTHAVTPCGHRCLCANCANLSLLGHLCPICRSDAHGLLRVYDP